MNATSGPTLPTPLAFLDPDGSSWRMSQTTLISEDQPLLQALCPTGIAFDGLLFELQMPVLPTNANDCSLLPTCRAQNGETRNMNIWKRPLGQPQNLENALARLDGDDTTELSDDGNELLGDQHQTQ